MKQILAYGDSLTWGADPVTTMRHPIGDLWPSVLQAGLGDFARVIGDGLGGRTTCFDDHAAPCNRNATVTLPVALSAHMPLDLVILMLGTNDLKPIHGGRAIGAEAGMRRLVHLVRTTPYKPADAVPKILIVSPPHCGPASNRGHDSPDRVEESRKFCELYARLAQEMGVSFFDAATVASPSLEDGVHLDIPNTRAIGAALIPLVFKIFA